jgi:O-antigen/teichoic acid export membrane protein
VLVLVASNFRAVFTFLIARVLGEAALGRFGLAFATVDLLSRVASLGLESAVVPFVARAEARGHRGRTRRLFAGSVAVGLAVSALVVAAGVPALLWFARTRGADAFTGGGAWMLFALPGMVVARICTGVSRGLLVMRSEFYSRGLGETWITTGVFALAVALGVRDLAPALAVVCGATGGAVIALALASHAVASSPRRPANPEAASGRGADGGLLRFSLPIALSGLLNTLAQRVDVLILGVFVNRAPGVTIESFGVFCAAVEIAGGLRKVRQVFDPILVPVAAARHVTDGRALRQTVAGPARWVLAGQLPIVGVLTLAGGAVLAIYGPAFRAGWLWLALLSLAHATNSFGGLVETLLMIERPSLNLLNAAVTVAVQALAAVLLIPAVGVTGAAVAMCVGFAVQGALRFVELRHVFGWSWPWRSLARPAAAFAIAFAPAVALRVLGGPGLEVPSGVVLLAGYALAWWWMGPDPADREVWQQLVQRRS